MSEIERRTGPANEAPLQRAGDYVLYWMTSARRPQHNFALDRAVDRARELGKPLVVLEALRCDYRWASDRLHHFVLDGMADNAAAFERTGILYHPYVEPERGTGRGLLEALAKRACIVVTDEFPGFFLPRMVGAAAAKLSVRLETVDSNGIVPLRAPGRTFSTAHSFRRWLQKELADHLAERPRTRLPRAGTLERLPSLPPAVLRRWPAAKATLLDPVSRSVAALPIDHEVARPADVSGGFRAGRARLRRFVEERLGRYKDLRNDPEAHVTSGLSSYLHFGHVAAHEVLAAVIEREGWNADRLSTRTDGSREGWWGMSPESEAFLDQLVTWRELGYNTAFTVENYERFESLPPWALTTLEEHWNDPRPHRTTPAQFERAATHDPLWNAAQRQLVREGHIHNYLRMLWGKKILEWSDTPLRALDTMIHLNNKYALDGRDPNSSSGIFWVLGRYDRPWGPERPIFGKVRYMSSENTARKVGVKTYVRQYAAAG
jgi:deoxyribodipyrimidine photo-lyase